MDENEQLAAKASFIATKEALEKKMNAEKIDTPRLKARLENLTVFVQTDTIANILSDDDKFKIKRWTESAPSWNARGFTDVGGLSKIWKQLDEMAVKYSAKFDDEDRVVEQASGRDHNTEYSLKNLKKYHPPGDGPATEITPLAEKRVDASNDENKSDEGTNFAVPATTREREKNLIGIFDEDSGQKKSESGSDDLPSPTGIISRSPIKTELREKILRCIAEENAQLKTYLEQKNEQQAILAQSYTRGNSQNRNNANAQVKKISELMKGTRERLDELRQQLDDAATGVALNVSNGQKEDTGSVAEGGDHTATSEKGGKHEGNNEVKHGTSASEEEEAVATSPSDRGGDEAETPTIITPLSNKGEQGTVPKIEPGRNEQQQGGFFSYLKKRSPSSPNVLPHEAYTPDPGPTDSTKNEPSTALPGRESRDKEGGPSPQNVVTPDFHPFDVTGYRPSQTRPLSPKFLDEEAKDVEYQKESRELYNQFMNCSGPYGRSTFHQDSQHWSAHDKSEEVWKEGHMSSSSKTTRPPGERVEVLISRIEQVCYAITHVFVMEENDESLRKAMMRLTEDCEMPTNSQQSVSVDPTSLDDYDTWSFVLTHRWPAHITLADKVLYRTFRNTYAKIMKVELKNWFRYLKQNLRDIIPYTDQTEDTSFDNVIFKGIRSHFAGMVDTVQRAREMLDASNNSTESLSYRWTGLPDDRLRPHKDFKHVVNTHGILSWPMFSSPFKNIICEEAPIRKHMYLDLIRHGGTNCSVPSISYDEDCDYTVTYKNTKMNDELVRECYRICKGNDHSDNGKEKLTKCKQKFQAIFSGIQFDDIKFHAVTDVNALSVNPYFREIGVMENIQMYLLFTNNGENVSLFDTPVGFVVIDLLRCGANSLYAQDILHHAEKAMTERTMAKNRARGG